MISAPKSSEVNLAEMINPIIIITDGKNEASYTNKTERTTRVHQ